MGLSIRNSEIL